MAINVRINQKGLFKRKYSVEELAGLRNLAYGVPDQHQRLNEGEIGSFTLLYDPNHIARGIGIYLDGYDVCLKINLPTSRHEIYLFYDLIGAICQRFNTDVFLRDEELESIDDLMHFSKEDDKVCTQALRRAQKEFKKGADNIMLLGAMNPIFLGRDALDEIDGDTVKYGDYLHRLQKVEAYYAAPTLFTKDDILYGVYFADQDNMLIFPKEPYTLSNKDVKEWFVMVSEDMIFVPFNAFIERAKVLCDYDANHFMTIMTKEDSDYLIENHKVDLLPDLKKG